jgi:hypothetical protein
MVCDIGVECGGRACGQRVKQPLLLFQKLFFLFVRLRSCISHLSRMECRKRGTTIGLQVGSIVKVNRTRSHDVAPQVFHPAVHPGHSGVFQLGDKPDDAIPDACMVMHTVNRVSLVSANVQSKACFAEGCTPALVVVFLVQRQVVPRDSVRRITC